MCNGFMYHYFSRSLLISRGLFIPSILESILKDMHLWPPQMDKYDEWMSEWMMKGEDKKWILWSGILTFISICLV